MSAPTLCLVGAGRAGASLARQWHARGGFRPVALHTRHGKAALAHEINAQDCRSLDQLPACDALLIASSDSAIGPIAAQLATRKSGHWQDTLVFHLSGALSTDALAPLAQRGARVASAHPVRAFSNEHSTLDDCWVGLEAEPHSERQLTEAFAAIGARCFTLQGQHKAKYHAAAVIASNHFVALADAAQQLWQSAGVDTDTSRSLFASLVTGVLQNLQQQNPAEALTGPIARADKQTINHHISALDSGSAEIAQLYRHNSQYLVHLLKDHHGTQITAELLAALAPPTPPTD